MVSLEAWHAWWGRGGMVGESGPSGAVGSGWRGERWCDRRHGGRANDGMVGNEAAEWMAASGGDLSEHVVAGHSTYLTTKNEKKKLTLFTTPLACVPRCGEYHEWWRVFTMPPNFVINSPSSYMRRHLITWSLNLMYTTKFTSILDMFLPKMFLPI
jgi:hypothetical protein